MGSTFKVLNTAIALETGAAKINQRFDVGKPMRISRFTITDYKPRNRPLNVPEIMVYSSNIGSARIAKEIGAETQRAYMDKLGLLDRLPLEVPETSKPLSPKTWRRTPRQQCPMVMAFRFQWCILQVPSPPLVALVTGLPQR